MQHFPVSSSVLSATELGNFIRDRYFLNHQGSCKLLKTFVNDTYLLTVGADKYIFRVYSYNWRSDKEISEEIRFIDILKQNNIAVSYGIRDKSGKYIQSLAAPEGLRYGVLFSYAPGRKIYNTAVDMHSKMGAYMASIHQLSATVTLERTDYTSQVLLKDSFEKFQSYLPGDSAERKFMLSTLAYLTEALEKINNDEVRHGAVHLDIWPDNLHIDAANNITLFDFDFCGNGWLCLDISFYLLMLFAGEPDEKEYRKKSTAFLEGYGTLLPITEKERQLIPVLGAGLYFYYLGVQSERFGTIFFNEEHLKKYILLRIKKWIDYNKIPVVL